MYLKYKSKIIWMILKKNLMENDVMKIAKTMLLLFSLLFSLCMLSYAGDSSAIPTAVEKIIRSIEKHLDDDTRKEIVNFDTAERARFLIYWNFLRKMPSPKGKAEGYIRFIPKQERLLISKWPKMMKIRLGAYYKLNPPVEDIALNIEEKRELLRKMPAKDRALFQIMLPSALNAWLAAHALKEKYDNPRVPPNSNSGEAKNLNSGVHVFDATEMEKRLGKDALVLLQDGYAAYLDPKKSRKAAIKTFGQYLEKTKNHCFDPYIYAAMGYIYSSQSKGAKRDISIATKYFMMAHKSFGGLVDVDDEHLFTWTTVCNWANGDASIRLQYLKWMIHLRDHGKLSDIYPYNNPRSCLKGKPVTITTEIKKRKLANLKATLSMFIETAADNFIPDIKENEKMLEEYAKTFPNEQIGMSAQKILKMLKSKNK